MDEDTKPVEDDSTPGASLTRRKALGLGAVAAGGAALAGLVEASGAEAAVAGTTTLKAAVAAGATTATVNSTTGLAHGYTIWIGTGSDAESAVIESVAVMTKKVTLTAGFLHAHQIGTRVSILPPVGLTPGPFREALAKLVNDPAYSAAAQASPQMITDDYPGISRVELQALRECAILSGADISAINSARATLISGSSGTDTGRVTVSAGGITITIGTSVSCCCCCCCGETGVVVR